jgi:hypothetical protein
MSQPPIDFSNCVQRVLDELRAAPSILIREPMKLERTQFPLDSDYESELADECDGLLFDDTMRTLWNTFDGVEIIWELEPGGEENTPGGVIQFSTLREFSQTIIWTDRDLEAMAPRHEAEEKLLRELHPIAVRDGAHWTGVRMRPDQPHELWFRADSKDYKLRGTFADYLDMLFKARGADMWPLLLLDLSHLPIEEAEPLRKYIVPLLRNALEVLESVETARDDVRELRLRLEDLRKALTSRTRRAKAAFPRSK